MQDRSGSPLRHPKQVQGRVFQKPARAELKFGPTCGSGGRGAPRTAGEAPALRLSGRPLAPELLSSFTCASFSKVDHPCEQCGTEVEDGRPFCPKCRAPQVRVEIAPLPPIPAGASSDLPIAPDHLNSASLRSSGDPVFFRTALQAGALGVMANFIPFGVGMVLTGILAALLYHRAHAGTLQGGKAARLGAVAGAIAFAATALLIVLAVVLLNSQQQFHDFMMKLLEQSVANHPDAEVQPFLQWIHTSQGFEIVLALFMVALLIVSMALSALGGVIGSVLFRDRNRPPL